MESRPARRWCVWMFLLLLLAGVPLRSEPLGPSSRRTGLIISEIMYHPLARLDGADLEFIELCNTQPYAEDLTGYRLSGAIDFEFPSGFSLAAGAFVVVAKDAAAIRAVYGIQNVIGNFTGALQNSSARVELRNKAGAVLLDARYADEMPWPIAADGAGHSLALTHPSFGESQSRAWSASSMPGGSPGRAELPAANSSAAIRINEWLAHTDDPELDYVELFNRSHQPIDISGWWLSDDAATNKFQIPNPTILQPRAWVAFRQDQLGFALSAEGERIFLRGADGARVIDAVRFKAQDNGVASGRFPDGEDRFVELTTTTSGSANSRPLERPVVISELMFHPLTEDSDDEFIELHNRSAKTIDLGGWKFTDGIDFQIPAGTSISPGGFLVVAKNKTQLMQNHPPLQNGTVVGNYTGTLANAGERVALAVPEWIVTTNTAGVSITNLVFVVVDEVNFTDGRRWSRWADGGGSSLELIDVAAENDFAANWADSDESLKSWWNTVENTGVLTAGDGNAASMFEVILLGPGECLLDDVEVISAGTSINRVANGTFESGTSGWVFEGTHERTSIETALGGFNSARSLRLRASGRGEYTANRVRINLTQPLEPGSTAKLRAKVRWLRGQPDIVLRLSGNWLEAAGVMAVPKNLGTPGEPNSRAVANAGPVIYDVSHAPILPGAGQEVRVKARVADPQGVAFVQLKFRADPATNQTAAPMNDSGLDGDEFAGDGVFTGRIPGRASGTVAFIIEAVDRLEAASRFPKFEALYPSDQLGPECLVRWADPVSNGSFPPYRIWLADATVRQWSARGGAHNAPLDATVVYGGERVVYNAGAYYSGSACSAPRLDSPQGAICGYNLVFPKDDLMLGEKDVILDANWPGGFATHEQVGFWIAKELGITYNHRRFVHLFVNGQRRGGVYEDAQQPNAAMMEQWFRDDPDGDLYKLEVWWQFVFWQQVNCGSYFHVRLDDFRLPDGRKNLARYRWIWQKRAVRGSANDYETLFDLVDAVNTRDAAAYTRNVEALVDVENWARIFAVEHIVGNVDSYGFSWGHNMYAYKPARGRWTMFMHDLDYSFNAGGSMFDGIEDPNITRLLTHPPFLRAYLRAMQDAIQGPLVATRLNAFLDANDAALRGNNVSEIGPQQAKSWFAGRVTVMQNELAARDGVFALEAPANQITTSNTFVPAEGTAPVAVREIRLNGSALPVTWSFVPGTQRPIRWQAQVPLQTGENVLHFEGFDGRGKAVPGTSVSRTVIRSGTPDRAEEKLVFNEIFYATDTGSAFVEVHNTSTTTAFDLSGWRMDGLDYRFAPGTAIAPNGFLVVARNSAAFTSVFGNVPLAGEFGVALSPEGQRLSLVRPGALPANDFIIDTVAYENQPPWPQANGASIQLIDPLQENARALNWTVQPTNAPPPQPEWVFVSLTGPATSSTIYLYLTAAAEVDFDELQLVAGGVAGAGPNLIRNGSFETGLTDGWGVSANHASSFVTPDARRSGASGLRLIATTGGSTRGSAIYQDIAPGLTIGNTYTLSFWFRPRRGPAQLQVRLSGSTAGSGIFTSNDFQGQPPPNPPRATPGAMNAVHAALPKLPALWINEAAPLNDNDGGITDGAGEREPWIELFNSGDATVPLDEMALTTSWNEPARWRFPAGLSIGPGQFLLVWCDGEPNETAGAELHTNFRLAAADGFVALTTATAQGWQALDYIRYAAVPSDKSIGFAFDGSGAERTVLLPTPAGPNPAQAKPPQIWINEWLAGNTRTLQDPADGDFEDWFELFNPQPFAVDLSGWFLTDTLTNQFKSQIADGIQIPAQGFLLVWADEEGSQTQPPSSLHVRFKLAGSGEEIGLTSPDGTLVDRIQFGQQRDDISEGRTAAGSTVLRSYETPTPGQANGPIESFAITEVVRTPLDTLRITWEARPGERYRLVMTPRLTPEPSWEIIGEIDAQSEVSFLNISMPDSTRFFKVVRIE
ncbi:MAG: lamin tail domain-containing protein [Verrucomicrobiota bacterium]